MLTGVIVSQIMLKRYPTDFHQVSVLNLPVEMHTLIPFGKPRGHFVELGLHMNWF